MSILIKRALHQGQETDILITGNKFSRIAPQINQHDLEGQDKTCTVIDAQGQVILPSLINGHTHAAMTLLRGYADDLELHTWLERYIWPLERKLTAEDIYLGAKLACLEMIKSGTTFFNDMYWHFKSTAQAVAEMGLRAALSSVFIDFNNPATARQHWKECLDLFAEMNDYPERISFALGPHAIYSVSEDSLKKIRDFAQKHDLLIHMHVAETRKEVEDCLQDKGKSPVQYLADLGLLNENFCACHCLWLSPEDMVTLAKYQVRIIYNPVSNLKLCSGSFPYKELKELGLIIGLGTDGCSSNNNLDLFEELKFASLQAKSQYHDPTLMPAAEAFELVTSNGAQIFRLACGQIAEGMFADCILVDLNHHQLTPNYNLYSNLVYAANGDCVQTTICDGQILMHEGHVPQEQEILDQVRQRAANLVSQ